MAVRVRAESSAYAWRQMGGPVKRDYSLVAAGLTVEMGMLCRPAESWTGVGRAG